MADFFRAGDQYAKEVLKYVDEHPKHDIDMHVTLWSEDGEDIIAIGRIYDIQWSKFYYDHFYDIQLDNGNCICVPTYRITRLIRRKTLRAI